MERLLHVEKECDGEMVSSRSYGTILHEEEATAAIKWLNKKTAGSTGVVSKMMKVSGGVATRWMTYLINNIVKEGSILDEWRKATL